MAWFVGGPRKKISRKASFLGVLALEVARGQELREIGGFWEKSCLKTYGRFFVLGEVWHTVVYAYT